MSSRASIFAIGAATLLLAACGDEKVSVYRVPKEKDPELPGATAAAADQPAGTAMADTSVPTASGADLVWQAPAAWKAGAPAPMRKATYRVAGPDGEAELSITAFPSDVGGELANVNRWRGQVGLAPVAAADLEASLSRVESHSLKFTIVELVPAGEKAEGILGAIVPFDGSTWFFKLKGPVSVLKSAKSDFIGFLHTVRAP